MRVQPSAFPFVAFGAITLFGLIATSPPSGSLADLHREREALVRSGVPTAARVTYKGHGRDSEWVNYDYRVGGRTYESGADPGPDLWYQVKVGDRLPVVYLPTDPSKSAYRPAEWLAGQETVGKTGWAIAGVGIVGLILSAVAAWARSAGILRDTSSLARLITVPRVIGALFFAAGMGFQLTMTWQKFFGEGVVMQVNGGPPHPIGGLGFVGMSLFLAIFWGVGLVLMSGKIKPQG